MIKKMVYVNRVYYKYIYYYELEIVERTSDCFMVGM